jgi:hypothetical protein
MKASEKSPLAVIPFFITQLLGSAHPDQKKGNNRHEGKESQDGGVSIGHVGNSSCSAPLPKGKTCADCHTFFARSLDLKHDTTSIALKAPEAKRGRGETVFFCCSFADNRQ